VGAPHSPLFSPPEAPPRPSLDVFFFLQKLPTLSHKANAYGINQLSTLGECVCEIAGVQVREVEGSHVTVLELKTHPEDLGKVIGREGRTAKAIRTILGAAEVKLHERVTLEILED